MNLTGKVALITGGTKGIGAATALALAKEGANVAITGRHDDEDARAAKRAVEALGRRCEVILGDLAQPAECTRAVSETVKRLGALDVLVHSAGGPVPGSLLELTPEAWNNAFDVHVHAIFHLSRAAVPHMKARKEGAIVLISSTAGKLAIAGSLAYQAVKGAIPQLTRALSRDLANDNIRVNCVAPGVVWTAFHSVHGKMTPAQRQHNLDNRIPLHRDGTPDQVADVILMLVKNDYMTGDTVTIDGGLTARIA
jgi:NAD(P)-dependent dehydrogenase (short-subunit alcohol dehydrogenase family)